jgi:hypothetical protein
MYRNATFLDVLKEEYCCFTNSWLSDADLEDEESLGLVDITAEVNRDIGLKLLGLAGMIITFIIILSMLLKPKKVKTN